MDLRPDAEPDSWVMTTPQRRREYPPPEGPAPQVAGEIDIGGKKSWATH